MLEMCQYLQDHSATNKKKEDLAQTLVAPLSLQLKLQNTVSQGKPQTNYLM